MNAVALRPAVKRTFAIRFRYLLMNAGALRPAFKKRCALCVIRTHIFLYLMNYLIHRYHCFFPHGAFFLFLWFCSCLMTSLLMIPGIKRNLFPADLKSAAALSWALPYRPPQGLQAVPSPQWIPQYPVVQLHQ